MPNAKLHRLGAAATIASVSAAHELNKGQTSIKPVIHGLLAGALGTLPDILEPATHPNHRQFFHSLGFAGLLGLGLYKLYQWEAKTEADQLLKELGLVAGGAYLVHLAMDASTPKSLPLV